MTQHFNTRCAKKPRLTLNVTKLQNGSFVLRPTRAHWAHTGGPAVRAVGAGAASVVVERRAESVAAGRGR